MKTKIINIKNYRANLASFWKESRKKHEKIIVTSHSKPVFEVSPIFRNDIELDVCDTDITKAKRYKLAEKSFGFWKSDKDDEIFNKNEQRNTTLKKITVCGSMKFFNKIELLKKELEHLGFIVFAPHKEGKGDDYSKLSKRKQVNRKQFFINEHIEKIKNSDAVLIANYDKNKISNYVGANTFLEMAFAYILNKKMFILNRIPKQSNTLEIEGFKPVVLNGKLNSLIKYM